MNDWLDQEKYDQAKVMADQHVSYLESLILQHQPDIPKNVLEQVKFHYRTAAIHFYGHGWEDAKSE